MNRIRIDSKVIAREFLFFSLIVPLVLGVYVFNSWNNYEIDKQAEEISKEAYVFQKERYLVPEENKYERDEIYKKEKDIWDKVETLKRRKYTAEESWEDFKFTCLFFFVLMIPIRFFLIRIRWSIKNLVPKK